MDIMNDYKTIKAKHPDALFLFRVGDFYETYAADAVVAAEILGITLTRRRNSPSDYIEMSGFPHHALDIYLPRLVRAGKRVAICDQLDEPQPLVKRSVTELVIPGDQLLRPSRPAPRQLSLF